MDIIRAEERHLAAIQQIYAWHVTNGSASFETAPPDIEEMRARLAKIRSAGLPWFVILEAGEVKGYCYLAATARATPIATRWKTLFMLTATFATAGRAARCWRRPSSGRSVTAIAS